MNQDQGKSKHPEKRPGRPVKNKMPGPIPGYAGEYRPYSDDYDASKVDVSG